MTFIVATNVVASRPPKRRQTGMPHAHAKIMAFLVATMSLPAVYRPNDDALRQLLERRTLVPKYVQRAS